MITIYALYHGEQFVTTGTVEEMAEYLNVKPSSVQFYASPTYKKRTKNEKMCVIKWKEEIE